MSDDPYVYPGTDVLRNLPGIRDVEELERFEARLTFLRGLQLASDSIAGKYDLAHLQAFHRYLFAGLYEWAGDLRTVVLARTDLFCLPEHIESSIGSLTTSATSTPCIRFVTATDAPSAPSLPSWPPTPATASTGSSSTRKTMSMPR